MKECIICGKCWNRDAANYLMLVEGVHVCYFCSDDEVGGEIVA